MTKPLDKIGSSIRSEREAEIKDITDVEEDGPSEIINVGLN